MGAARALMPASCLLQACRRGRSRRGSGIAPAARRRSRASAPSWRGEASERTQRRARWRGTTTRAARRVCVSGASPAKRLLGQRRLAASRARYGYSHVIISLAHASPTSLSAPCAASPPWPARCPCPLRCVPRRPKRPPPPAPSPGAPGPTRRRRGWRARATSFRAWPTRRSGALAIATRRDHPHPLAARRRRRCAHAWPQRCWWSLTRGPLTCSSRWQMPWRRVWRHRECDWRLSSPPRRARRKLCLTCRWRATPLACTRGALPPLLLGAACSRALCLPSRPGAFEVTTEDGRPVFSRLDARYYPARTELVDRVRRALPRKTAGVGGVA